MLVQLKVPISFDKKQYSPGKHDFSGEMLDHWFIKGLIKDSNLIVDEVVDQVVNLDEVVNEDSKGKNKKKKKG